MPQAGGAIFALSAFKAVSQINQGYAEKAEAGFNASMMENKAKMIDVQSGIEQGQFVRAKGNVLSESMAGVAGMGLQPTGSPLAVMITTQKNITIDQSIAKFNADMAKNYTMAEASAYRRKGKQAMYSGWSNGLVSAMEGVVNYDMYKNGIKLNQGAEKAGKP